MNVLQGKKHSFCKHICSQFTVLYRESASCTHISGLLHALSPSVIDNVLRRLSKSALWYSVRRYRITASMFGSLQRLPSTLPDSLVKELFGPTAAFNKCNRMGETT